MGPVNTEPTSGDAVEPATAHDEPASDEAAVDATEASHALGVDPRAFGGGYMRVPPWVQMVGLPLLILFGWIFAQAASHAVMIFLVSGLISLLLNPVVRGLTRAGFPRGIAVILVFVTFIGVIMLLVIAGANVATEQATNIRENSTQYGAAAIRKLDQTQDFIDNRGWNIDVREQGSKYVNQLAERSSDLSRKALDLGRDVLQIIAETAFNLVLTFVICVYMLLDAPRIGRFVSSTLPSGSQVETLFGRMEHALLRYTIGQTLASLVMGASAALGLYLMGITGIWESATGLAVLFGVIVAITEFAPTIGPVIGAIPPIITAFVDGVGPGIAVTLFFLLLHQIEGHIVIPKLMGAAIAVHPLLVIFGIIAGAQIMGLGGMLLALPLLAVGREIVMFVRERVVLGHWPDPLPVGTPILGPDSVPGSPISDLDAETGTRVRHQPSGRPIWIRVRDAARHARRAIDDRRSNDDGDA